MALSAAAFSVMAALVKLAGSSIPNQELVALRSLASIVPIAILMRLGGVPFRAHRPGWLLVRGLLGYVAISCWFVSLNHLPLADAVMIQYTSPVFVALGAPLVLGERAGRRDLAALAVALAGVALVVRPGFALTAGGALVGLAGAVCSAGAYLTVRALRRSDHPFVVMLAFPLVAGAASLAVVLPATLAGDRAPEALHGAAVWVWPGARGWVLIGGIALMTAVGQVFLTYGLHWEPAGRATVATYLAVVVSIPLGIALFGQWPDPAMLLGGAMVVGAVAALALTSGAPVPPPAGAGGGQLVGGVDGRR